MSDNALDTNAGSFLDTNFLEWRGLAETAYADGDYTEAAAYYLSLLWHNVDDYETIYQLARCYGWLNQAELAAAQLERAVRKGFHYTSQIDSDPAFEQVRSTPVFQQAVTEAKVWVYEVMLEERFRHALDNYSLFDPLSIYELACCYAMKGEPALAAQHLEQAVNAGFTGAVYIEQDEAFDAVRGDPQFAEVATRLIDQIRAEETDLGQLLYLNATASCPCYAHLPTEYEPNASYPLVIGLHGYDSNSVRFTTLWHAFADPHFIYVAPQAPYAIPGSSNHGYSWAIWEQPGDDLGQSTLTQSEQYVLDVISRFTATYNISDVYLLGFSQGAILAYRIALTHSERIAGIACISGKYESQRFSTEQLHAANTTRVFIAHGLQDQAVSIDHSATAKAVLELYGFDVTYHEFEGGHTFTPEVLQEIEAWIAAGN